MGWRFLRRFTLQTRTAATAVVLALASAAAATDVHVNSLPSGFTFNKTANAYMYLEGETATQGANDTFANAADASKTFYRTGASPSDSWGSAGAYDLARYAARGGDTGTYSNVNAYWENVSTGLPTGSYDVFIRALPGSSGSQTFSLYIGSDLISANAAAVSGTVSTAVAGTARWYKLATVDLANGIDTFRLSTNTTNSTVRFDTLFFAGPAVPEPSAGLLATAAAGMLVCRRRRRLMVG